MTDYHTPARRAWLAQRRSGIGGSDIGAILGENPYRTALDVWLDKTGRAEPSETSEAAHFGTLLEGVVADEYAARTGRRVQRVNQILRHRAHPWALANIDRAIVNPDIAGNVRWRDERLSTDRILECKTANAFAAGEWGEEGSDGVPPSYLLQVQWYMGVTSTQCCDIAVLIGGQQFRIYTIARDDELIAAMLERAAEFWRLVETDTPPEATSASDCAHLWRKHTAGKSIIVGDNIAAACARLAEIAAEEKTLRAEADELKAEVMAAMQDAEECTHGGRKLATWKTQSTTRFDSTACKSAQPDVWQQYAKTTESRVFRLAR